MIRRPPRSTLFPTRRSSDLTFDVGSSTWRIDTIDGIRYEQMLDKYFLDPSGTLDRKSTRLNSSHANISYAVFCLKKKKQHDLKYTSTPYHINETLNSI